MYTSSGSGSTERELRSAEHAEFELLSVELKEFELPSAAILNG